MHPRKQYHAHDLHPPDRNPTLVAHSSFHPPATCASRPLATRGLDDHRKRIVVRVATEALHDASAAQVPYSST